VVAQLREQGLRVFLDLKFHDIPATMAGACRRAAALGAELITVHACAGSEALNAAQSAAVEGAQSSGQPSPTLLAVTVLTSWEEQRLQRELAISQGIAARVSAFGPAIGHCRYWWMCVFALGGRGITGSTSRAVCIDHARDSPQRAQR
jgi:orotidine-5'-phosphate decarboxylase